VAKPSTAFAVIRSILYACLFMSIWLYWVPSMLAPGRSWKVDWGHLATSQVLGLVLLAIGAAISLSCVLAFGTHGRGTPAPFDPPRALVKNWLYSQVRNPMYLGLGVLLTGEALLFPQRRGVILGMMAVLFVVVHLFVVLYEEPTLRRLFGPAYEEYCRKVPRWIPRVRFPG
jgi:protein-S-isoprenylcysteine O-methyltransferase Ste14